MNERLWEAARLNQVEDCRKLLDVRVYGDLIAQVNAKGLTDWTALHIAANEGSTDVMRVLVANEETDLSALTELRQTALHIAAAKGYLDIVQVLVSAGSGLDAQDYTGCTALHLVAKNNRKDTAAWLLGHDPAVRVVNDQGKTAYQECTSAEMADLFEIYYKERGIGFEPLRPQQIVQDAGPDNTDQIARTLTKKEQPKALRMFLDQLKKPLSGLIEENARRKDSGPEDVCTYMTWADFEPKHTLGQGTFGTVYYAVKKDTRIPYALKVLDKATIKRDQLFKYAVTERNVLCAVAHPFIVGLNWAFQTPEKLVLVLDYCPGGDLESMIEREKHLSEDIAKIYLSEIVLAVEELHRRDILYRDLKPQNVLLDAQGHAVLTDFGLSKEQVKDDEVAESFCGSQAYMAPEVLNEAGHQKSVDWYLLGACFYEMLTGAPPFYSQKVKDLYANIKAAKLKIPKTLSPAASDLISRLLTRNPRERLGSGPLGAKEIQAHPFFADVDWSAVMRRQLRPPQIVRVHKKQEQDLDAAAVYGNLDSYDADEMFEGWAYAGVSQS